MADLSQKEGRASVLAEGGLAWAAWVVPSTYKAALKRGLSVSESGQWVLTIELPGAHSNRCWLLGSRHLPLSRCCSCGEGSRGSREETCCRLHGHHAQWRFGEWGLGQGPTAPLFTPDGGSQEKENTWERQEELGENREAIPGGAQCRALGGGGHLGCRRSAAAG